MRALSANNAVTHINDGFAVFNCNSTHGALPYADTAANAVGFINLHFKSSGKMTAGQVAAGAQRAYRTQQIAVTASALGK